jgi:DUF1680 family protein
MMADNNSTCCEGQGTRILGSLPEYIYSMGPKSVMAGADRAVVAPALYVNLYVASRYQTPKAIGQLSVQIDSQWPESTNVTITLLPASDHATATAASDTRSLVLRIPSWTSAPTVVRLVPTREHEAHAPPVIFTGVSARGCIHARLPTF